MSIPEPKMRMQGWKKSIYSLLVLCIALIVACTALFIAYQSTQQVKGTCGFYRDIATASIPPKTQALGLRIVADARYAVDHMDCGGKPLPPPDPRLMPYLNRYPN